MILVIGLGPGELERVPEPMQRQLLDPSKVVICRTVEHPAAAELAVMREVVFCDDLYERSEAFEDVYASIVERVTSAAQASDVVYAVPGSPTVGEFAVRRLQDEIDHEVVVYPGESFVDAVLRAVSYDPLDRGMQVLNGHDLPDPLVLDKPTIIAHLDSPEVLADVSTRIGRVVEEGSTVELVVDGGSSHEQVVSSPVDDVDLGLAGLRTSMFVDAHPGGLIGAVSTMRVLRRECPWDREQTHDSLVKNLVEESHELIEAIDRLGEDPEDLVSYAAVEDELGDVLLQVLFHAAIAREAGAFDIDDAAEVMRQKLVRRHPHVFGEVEVGSAEEVKANWDRIKEAEPGRVSSDSALDGVPAGMPSLYRASKIQNRAAKVGFDWELATEVLAKVEEEVTELEEALAGTGDEFVEMGDILFSLVNLSRHLGIDPDAALRASTSRFETRFRRMERHGALEGLTAEELDERWNEAKRET